MLGGLILLAFVLRLAAGLYRGPAFFDAGYAFYTDIAASLLAGDGFCYAPGEGCAIRMPLYPALVAPFLAIGFVYPGLIVLQSALGAGQVWLVSRLGRLLVNRQAGLIAAVMTALNPYAVLHDSAFQDTVVFNTLVVAAAVALLEAVHARSTRLAAVGGVAVGLAMLTSGRVLLLLPCVLVWLAFAGEGEVGARLRRAALVAVVLLLMVGGWTLRNWKVVGAPVLSTETGLSLWVANHPLTLARFPQHNIDTVTREAWEQLPPHLQDALNAASEVSRDDLFAAMAIDHVRADPGRAAGLSLRKLAAGLSGQLSPARDGAAQFAFAAIFVPVHLLAAIGVWLARPWPAGHWLSILVFASFGITTAIFWAHTSHASYLHPWLFVYAASAARALAGR